MSQFGKIPLTPFFLQVVRNKIEVEKHPSFAEIQ